MIKTILLPIIKTLSNGKFPESTLQIFGILVIIFIVFLSFRQKNQTNLVNFVKKIPKARLNKIILTLAYLSLINYIGLVIIYTFSSEYIDHAEPNIAAVSWLFQTGKSIYPPLDSAERYINNYGPILYVINGFVLQLFTPSIISSKIAGAVAALSSLSLIFFTVKKIAGNQKAIVISGYISLMLLMLNKSSGLVASSFWVRPDPLLIFCTSLGMFAVVNTSLFSASLLCALSLGIACNLKIFALLYFVPIYVIFYRRAGLLYTLGSLFGAGIVAITPFFYFQQLSLENYIVWLRAVSKQGISIDEFTNNLKWIIYTNLPLLILLTYLFKENSHKFKEFIDKNRIYILSLLFSLVGVATIGGKSGALENNMLPLLPMLTCLFAEAYIFLTKAIIWQKTNWNKSYFSVIWLSMCLATLIYLPIIVIPNEATLMTRLLTFPGNYAVKDIENIVKSYPDATIGMGYGKNYEMSFFRPVLVFRGNPYLLDAASMMEMKKSGINPVSVNTLDNLRSCQTKLWLLPKNYQPFDLISYYAKDTQLLNDEFKTIFHENYELKNQTKYYALWLCKEKRVSK